MAASSGRRLASLKGGNVRFAPVSAASDYDRLWEIHAIIFHPAPQGHIDNPEYLAEILGGHKRIRNEI